MKFSWKSAALSRRDPMPPTPDPFQGFLVTGFWGWVGLALAGLVADLRFRACLKRRRPDQESALHALGFRGYQAYLARGEYRQFGFPEVTRWGRMTILLRRMATATGWLLLAAYVGWKLAGGAVVS